MNIETITNLFFIFLLIVGVISFFVGVGFMRIFKNYKTGFLALFGLSFLLNVILFEWYQSALLEIAIGTIPIVFTHLFAIVLYFIYLIISWFVLRRINKQNLLTNSG
ncbi:hypothetical protein [Litchfieldia salsa]|uniref:Uncharacterized protein n=1 Tax=Litchfieldia salsa TaxID=930152 RepID=A0A1H0SYK5_9BACI|nr:hypothetical protein [Litchfieldia salsa]SDP46650.1 hypothetical protein SAMN05216565_103180 [Litchfieldia salsa]